MISLKELLKGADVSKLPKDHRDNLEVLLFRLNKFRTAYGQPMIVTSGYRTREDHLRIYRQKGIIDIKKIPMGSKHLSGCAADFADPNGELMAFAKSNQTFLEQVGLWAEDGTKGWLHLQSKPFGSYKRGGTVFFWP